MIQIKIDKVFLFPKTFIYLLLLPFPL